jgi:thiopurine S-methyltransferase
VLVPLCGKSKDLSWLAEQGHDVIGVEVAEEAIKAFEDEAGEQEHVEIICADFFQLRPKKLGTFPWIFDRGALVALDAEGRAIYAQHEASFLDPGGRIFLIAVEYDDSKMSGPPFSVPETAVRALYPAARLIERLADRDCLEQRFIDRGLSAMREAAYAISF